MQMILKRDWDAIDATDPKNNTYTTIPAGTHDVERIPCPTGHDCNWLVLKGTKIGASEGSWRQWAPGQIVDDSDRPNFGKVIDWEEATVVIVD